MEQNGPMPYSAPQGQPDSDNSERDQGMPMKPCPACGTNDWKQSPEQAQKDQYECAKCGYVANGKDIEMENG